MGYADRDGTQGHGRAYGYRAMGYVDGVGRRGRTGGYGNYSKIQCVGTEKGEMVIDKRAYGDRERTMVTDKGIWVQR